MYRSDIFNTNFQAIENLELTKAFDKLLKEIVLFKATSKEDSNYPINNANIRDFVCEYSQTIHTRRT